MLRRVGGAYGSWLGSQPVRVVQAPVGEVGRGQETSKKKSGCPDIWELDNGDIAVIGRDLTASYGSRLPAGVALAPDERLVVIPGIMLRAAKPDIPDD
jgi:hypothetical protein